MHVVATAGHVDHGKSTLVRALTGSDPDRLEEEQRRGLTIELGYCWTSLPDVGDIAFVDVPGHQRFIATTLSGVGPVPVAMLVVAADDPWMPQAAEHLAALDALGVRHGLLVVTRADLADPAPALARAREELAGTTLAGVPHVVVSGRTGAGLDELRATLTRVLQAVPRPDPGADVRFWVDRRFTVRGTGTVVTGTLPAGTITVGDTLDLGDQTVRVRGLQCLETPVPTATGVARVAIDLGGKAPAHLDRGSALVTPGAYAPTTVVDVRLAGRSEARVPEQPVLHLGTSLVGVRARPLDASTARLTLDRPLPLRIGDRALLRDPGSREIWGLEVLDPAPPSLRRRGAAAARARVLVGADGSIDHELATRGVVRRSLLRRIGVEVSAVPDGTLEAGDWLVSPARAERWRTELPAVVTRLATPLQPGVPEAAVAHELGLPDPGLVAGLVTPPLRLDRGRVVAETAADVVPESLRPALEALRAELADDPFHAPDAGRLQALRLDKGAVAALHRGGHVLRLADGIVLLAGADDDAVTALRGLPQPFTASEARTALGTSRRVVLPLLAHLDRTGRTLRLPDDRRRVRDA